MADSYVNRPRQCQWVAIFHPAEVTHNICQQAVLSQFTEEELKKIAMAVQTELQSREP